jgi:hypothetical protein
MKYHVILKDHVILTDDYEDKEFKTLVKNLQADLNKLNVDYPVDVWNEDDKKVITLLPI